MFNFKKVIARCGTQKAPGNDSEKLIVEQLYTDNTKKSINYDRARIVLIDTTTYIKKNKKIRNKNPAILPLLDMSLTLLETSEPERILQDIDNPGLYCCPSCFKYIDPNITHCRNCGSKVIPIYKQERKINDVNTIVGGDLY